MDSVTTTAHQEAAEEASSAHSRLVSTFQSGTTRPYEWRAAQLTAILDMLRHEDATLKAALSSDLGKGSFEADMTELHLVRNSAEYMLRHLRRWMRGTSATSSLPWFFRWGGSAAHIVPQPLGVALILSPWNFPLLLALDPLVAAIAAGNAAVVKPSELAPATAGALSHLLPRYLDPAAVAVITGGAATSVALLAHRWDKIFFTGSPHVARSVMAAAATHLTPLTLELGGKCPTLVHRTADLRSAARRIASGKWALNAGQTCVAPDYVLVDRSVSAVFLDALATALREFGFGAAAAAQRLPHIVNRAHWERLAAIKEEAVKGGAVEVRWWEEGSNGDCPQKEGKEEADSAGSGGGADQNGSGGAGAELYMAPTILHNPTAASRAMTEEIFGPILPVVEVEDVMADGLEIVRRKGKPLAMYVFVGGSGAGDAVWHDPGKALAACGAVVINDATTQFSLESIPFGGVGESGMGAYHGRYGFDAFSHYLPIVSFPASGDSDLRFPPYSTKAEAILGAIARRRSPFQLLRILFTFSLAPLSRSF